MEINIKPLVESLTLLSKVTAKLEQAKMLDAVDSIEEFSKLQVEVQGNVEGLMNVLVKELSAPRPEDGSNGKQE